MQKIFLILLVITFSGAIGQKTVISGYLLDSSSRESIVGANIFIPQSNSFTQSNAYGFFVIHIEKTDTIEVFVSMVGYQKQRFLLPAMKDNSQTLLLIEDKNELLEIEVRADAFKKVSENIEISRINIPIAQIKDIPSLLGEKDIIKALQLLPGVQNGNEGSNGLFVRGGGADQNLILLDEAKVYNVSHLFGFFSVFNGDALKSLDFFKGGFPARYGGRVSSVLDVKMKDGSKTKAEGQFGVGLISTRLTYSMPVVKNKSSIIVSARRTYPDVLFSLFKNEEGGVLKSNFYDLNAKYNHDFNKKNKLFISTYLGNDNFFQRVNQSGDSYRNTGFKWGNQTATARWNHLFSQKLFSNMTIIASKFNYQVINEFGQSAQIFSSNLAELGLKYDFELFPNNKHEIRYGVNASHLNFVPNLTISKENNARTNSKQIERITALDAAFYVEDTYKLGSNFILSYGLRSAFFKPNDAKLYSFLEPRFSFNYSFTKNWSFKGAYSVMNQPIQLLSNNGLGLSIDVWVPSTANMPPQHSTQFTLGLAHDLKSNITIELEVYQKEMENILAFKEGSSIFSTVDLFKDRDFTDRKIIWNDIATAGLGTSKGIELFVQKKEGRLTGWIGYSLSKTENTFELLNQGKTFYPRHDRRHQFSSVFIYEFSKRIKFSSNLVLGSGTPFTLPISTFEHISIDPFTQERIPSFNSIVDYGDQRNQFRSPIYQRLDVSIQFQKQKEKVLRTWEFGFYNATGHKNVFAYEAEYNVRFENEEPVRIQQINQVAFLLFIPSISYNLKF